MFHMEPHAFENLGGKEKPVDERDIKLGAVTPKIYTFPKVKMNQVAWNMPVEYQGQQPACGAHSGAALNGIKRNSRYSPRFTWGDIKSFDGNPIEAGTDLRSIFKSITKAGTLDFNLLANDVGLPLAEYAHPIISAAMKANAIGNKALGYGFADDLTFNGLKQYINDRGAVIILFRVGNEMWTAPNGQPSWAEKDILPLRPPKPIVSGHFVVGHSYDEQNIYFLNSFSKDWGRNGHGYFGENYMPFINDAGALIPLAFTKDLQKGMTDPEVKELQKILNKNPKTQVAISGVGSPGKETDFFGDLTLKAVIKFQTLYSIKPNVGYVGPVTRAVLNGLAG